MEKGLKEVGKAIGGNLMAPVTEVEKYFIGGIFIQSEGCQSGVEVADRQKSLENIKQLEKFVKKFLFAR